MPRQRWVYRKDETTGEVRAIEVDTGYTGAERRAPVTTEALVYGNAGRATDGTPIDSRTKHRDYMKQHGLAMATDYTETWSKAEAAREAAREGNFDRQARREAIARAVYTSPRGRK